MSTKAINTVRVLSAEAIQKANSGHPGLPLGAAPTAFTLWSEHMNHNPLNPKWDNRDRFVLSAGHGSALIYSLLHLFSYGLTIEDLKNFRQLNSLTPGHPEYNHTVGVEVTTGPLGQGIANAVGMALAESYLGNKFNTEKHKIVDHYTYALCGDGCLMEGVSAEAISLAGTLELGKLILFYDSNKITIEGSTDIAFREDVIKRFDAYNWHTLEVTDGNNTDEITKAIVEAKKNSRPTLIKVNTLIGYGAPNKQGKSSAHGEPLGVDEIKLMKENFGFTEDEFTVSSDVKNEMEKIVKKLKEKESTWNKLVEEYKSENPELYKEYLSWYSNNIEVDLLKEEDFWTYEGDLATRVSSEKVLNKACKYVPNLFGGSADLAPSTKTIMKDRGDFSKEDRSGANLHFGIREHAMTAMANGMALHGGVRPYISGFFVFADYMKPSLRLAALMNQPIINILTHDSIGVGEDGPTHQPIEQLAMLRSLPNFTVFRPCDTNETAAAWYLALNRQSPSALVLTRQGCPIVCKDGRDALKGGYIIKDCSATPDAIIIATGSEVALGISAAEELSKKGKNIRVVSMLSFEVFEEQSPEYKEAILPKSIRARVGVEAASNYGWHKYIGFDGELVTMSGFGASAPAKELFNKFGFTVENIVNKVESIL
ncbi:MAG: transketolase [Lachnospirales bacterium]